MLGYTSICGGTMRTVNIHEAKTHLSRLIDAAVAGEHITIAKDGQPMVKLVRVSVQATPPRTGFLAGQGRIPDDFTTMHAAEIAELFADDS